MFILQTSHELVFLQDMPWTFVSPRQAMVIITSCPQGAKEATISTGKNMGHVFLPSSCIIIIARWSYFLTAIVASGKKSVTPSWFNKTGMKKTERSVTSFCHPSQEQDKMEKDDGCHPFLTSCPCFINFYPLSREQRPPLLLALTRRDEDGNVIKVCHTFLV